MKLNLSITNFYNQLFISAGQIMLQENKWTGFLFVVGLLIVNIKFAVAAVLAIIIANTTAFLLRFDSKNIQAGLYGFNAALIGVGLIFLFNDTLLIWILIFVGSITSSLLQQFFILKKIPAYTFPFIVITWTLVFFIQQFTTISSSDFISKKIVITKADIYFMLLRNYGQVIFQSNIFASTLFFIAVFINHYQAAINGLIAAFLAILFFYNIHYATEQIYIGVVGFNAVLTAIALTNKNKNSLIWLLIGVAITILLQYVFIKFSVFNKVGGIFTFPFVAATWITLLIQKFFKKGKISSTH